jgi:hypothetical protein
VTAVRIPRAEHQAIARRLVTAARHRGIEYVTDELTHVKPGELALVVHALARLAVVTEPTDTMGRRGQPPVPFRFTLEERREAHRLYAKGLRTAYAIAGEREYKRGHQQARRARLDEVS